jgi:hypothetical protein
MLKKQWVVRLLGSFVAGAFVVLTVGYAAVASDAGVDDLPDIIGATVSVSLMVLIVVGLYRGREGRGSSPA